MRASYRAGHKRGEAIPNSIDGTGRGREAQLADRDAAWFLSEITPRLDAYSLSQIAKATGLSLAACSRFRAERASRTRGFGGCGWMHWLIRG